MNAIPSDYLTRPNGIERDVYESISDPSERNSRVPSIVEQPLHNQSNDNIRVGLNVPDSNTIPSVYLTGRNMNELNLYDSIPEGMEGVSVPRELSVLINDGLPNVNAISSVYLTQQNENERHPNGRINSENESNNIPERSILPHDQTTVGHNLESGAMPRNIDNITSVYLTDPSASNSQDTYLVPVNDNQQKPDIDSSETNSSSSNGSTNGLDMATPNPVTLDHNAIPSVYLTQQNAIVMDPIYYG